MSDFATGLFVVACIAFGALFLWCTWEEAREIGWRQGYRQGCADTKTNLARAAAGTETTR